MAVASWMLGVMRSGRFNRSRLESKEDIVKLDLDRDPRENAKEILESICKVGEISEGKRINYLNAFVKLALHINGDLSKIALSVEDVLCCLRVSLVNESTQVRAAGLRAIRHILRTSNDLVYFNKLLIPFLVARSLDLALKNDVERIQALRLMRKVLMLSASSFDIAMARSLVSLANGGIEEKDRMLRACLACLSEIGVLNSDLFILSGGVTAITRNLLECQLPKIAESLCGILLLLLDRPTTRNSAGIDLHCIAAPYCDFHYRHGWMDKNRDERELRFNCSRLALLSILRSWPGIMQFCNPSNALGLKAIVNVLYLNQLEVRKALLDLLYELLGLPQPEWTDELSVALSAVDPAEPQSSWRLNEGFVVAEGRSILPHLCRTTPSIIDMHLSLLLYCFLETGLLSALSEVIATSDTFISVRATVLLGELLRLIQIFLPPECCNITPALPNLLGYATTKPQALGAVTALQQLHKLMKRRPASSSLYLDYILQCGNFMKSPRSMEQNKKYKLSHSKSKLHQLITKEGEDVIRDTGVLYTKDAFEWNWNLIKMIVKGETDFKVDLSESSHRSFLKRLVDFYMPSSNKYSHMDLTSSKNTQGYTIVGIELIQCLVRLEDAESNRLLLDLFRDIFNHVAAITTAKSAHDCLFSPQHMANTQCQSYFLLIGRLGSTRVGVDILHSLNFFQQLQHLATTTNHDCYVKLIVSSLDYKESGPARKLLSAVLKCSNESSRLYATQFLQVLLRAGLPNFAHWGIKQLAGQLNDKSRSVHLAALSALHEACEVPSYLEQLVKLNPDVLHLGEKGVLLLIRFLSISTGFNALKKNDFVINEIKRWDEFFNYRYVRIVEGETSDALTLHQRGEDGRYDKRFSSLKVINRKDLFLPPHLYGQLSKHTEGFQLLLVHGSIEQYIQYVENGFCETERDIRNLKVALWAIGHLGSTLKGIEHLQNREVLFYIIRIAQHCPVYSIRATAFYILGLIAVTKTGADCLYKLGWVCTRHDRHTRYPIIEEENWADEALEGIMQNVHFGSDSEYASGDHAFNIEYCLNIPDVDCSDDDLLYGVDTAQNLTVQQKSSTLPSNQSYSNIQHKRSLSESKTFDVLKLHEQRTQDRVEFRLGADVPHRYRDNSITESTTSGVSSCESVLGKINTNDRVQTLSPIPSSSSLSTLKTSGVKIGRSSERARRISVQSASGTIPSDRSTISPAGSTSSRLSQRDLMGYAVLRSLRSMRISQHLLYGEQDYVDILSLETASTSVNSRKSLLNAENHPSYRLSEHARSLTKNLFDSLSLRSFSSVQKFSVKEDMRNKEQFYMGICLPQKLTDLFPDESLKSHRLSVMDKSITPYSEDSDPDTSLKVKKEKNRFVHDMWTCMKCSKIRRSQHMESHSGSLGSFSESNLAAGQQTFEDDFLEAKCDILTQVERLSNPVWTKASRQVLLVHKQKHPHLFQDICLYSEVCKIISQHTYRLGPRRLLQELFLTVNFSDFYAEANSVLSENKSTTSITAREFSPKAEGSGKSYYDTSLEQRKIELSNVNAPQVTNKKIVYGFTIGKGSESDETERLSPTRYEPRSPPLSSVKEESLASSENLLEGGNKSKSESSEQEGVVSQIKRLDSLNLSYKQNKFPIKNRNETKNVIKEQS